MGSYIKRDGTNRGIEYPRYVCYHRSRGHNDCDGAITYNAEKVDRAVMSIMRSIFSNIFGCRKRRRVRRRIKMLCRRIMSCRRSLSLSFRKTKSSLKSFAARFRNLLLERVFIRVKIFLSRLTSSNRESQMMRKHSKN